MGAAADLKRQHERLRANQHYLAEVENHLFADYRQALRLDSTTVLFLRHFMAANRAPEQYVAWYARRSRRLRLCFRAMKRARSPARTSVSVPP